MSNVARLAVLTGALTSLLLAACGSAAPAPVTLDGRTFLSTGVDGHALVGGTQVQLTFHDGTSIGASAGCNSIGGTYTVVNGALRVQAGGMTEMGCDPARHDQDDWLVAFLTSNPTVTLSGNDLTLTKDGTTIRLLDREVAQPDLPLVGPVWTLDSIIAGDAVSSVPGGVVATLTFTPDGNVQVNAGCNTGGGSAAVQGGTILFGAIATTKRACEAPAGQVESAVLEVLRQGQVAFTIDAARLTLVTPDGKGLGFISG
jgi:heat shock protein HslJ